MVSHWKKWEKRPKNLKCIIIIRKLSIYQSWKRQPVVFFIVNIERKHCEKIVLSFWFQKQGFNIFYSFLASQETEFYINSK